jgi:hypothetical protein
MELLHQPRYGRDDPNSQSRVTLVLTCNSLMVFG